MDKEAVFFGFGVVSAQSQVNSTCSFAEASPKPKNPRSPWLQYFLNRSKTPAATHWLKFSFPARIRQCIGAEF
jgi:hypothetical protein